MVDIYRAAKRSTLSAVLVYTKEYYRLSHDVVNLDVDRYVSTALRLVFI